MLCFILVKRVVSEGLGHFVEFLRCYSIFKGLEPELYISNYYLLFVFAVRYFSSPARILSIDFCTSSSALWAMLDLQSGEWGEVLSLLRCLSRSPKLPVGIHQTGPCLASQSVEGGAGLQGVVGVLRTCATLMFVWRNFCSIYRGFPTRMVYLDYITCLRYTIVVRNPRYSFL